MDLARRLATVTTTAPAGGPPSQPSSRGEPVTSSGNTPEEVPESVRHISEAIRTVVPLEKLVAQAAYFKLPPWAALPSCPLHLECRREGARMAPLALHQFPCYLLGNSSTCDYRLEHPSISRVHCALVFHGEMQCFVVVDLRSTNGVRVDGVRIEPNKPVPLAVGSVLTVGQSNRTYEMKRGVATREGAAGCAPEKSITTGIGNGTILRAEVVTESHSVSAALRVAGTSALPRVVGGGSFGSFACDSLDSLVAASTSPSTTAAPRASEDRPVTASRGPPVSPGGSPAVVTSTSAPTPSRTADGLPSPAERSNATTGTAPETAPPAQEEQVDGSHDPAADTPRRLRHVLLKHKDCPNAKSMNPSNKGQIIGRTLQEALRLAETIRALHPVWTEAEFCNAALQYSECSTSKAGGDLGIVSRGDFTAEFEDPCFAIREGEVSTPFVTTRGVHLVFRCPTR